MNRSVDELMEELYSVITNAWHLPLSGGRAMVDGNEIHQLLDELRDNLPQETRQARAIVADRNQIIADAKREAENIVRSAEERSKRMLQAHEITKQAQQSGDAIVRQARAQAKEINRASSEFVEKLFQQADETLNEHLVNLRRTHQNIKSAMRKRNG